MSELEFTSPCQKIETAYQNARKIWRRIENGAEYTEETNSIWKQVWKLFIKNVHVFYFPPPIYSNPPDFTFQSITQPPYQLFPPLPPDYLVLKSILMSSQMFERFHIVEKWRSKVMLKIIFTSIGRPSYKHPYSTLSYISWCISHHILTHIKTKLRTNKYFVNLWYKFTFGRELNSQLHPLNSSTLSAMPQWQLILIILGYAPKIGLYF